MRREPDATSTGRILRSAIQARVEAQREAARTGAASASDTGSILDVIHQLKDKIEEKDRIIRRKTSRLLATRNYLESIFEALAEAVVVIDQGGAIEFVNQAAADLIGCPRTELIGHPATELCAEQSQATQFEGQALAESFLDETTRRSELLLRTAGGKSIPIAWTTTLLALEDRPPRLLGIARDVRIERRLAEEKLRAVRALAASVAHEIRNPLGAIQNAVGLLRRDLPLEPEDRTLMDIVYRETDRISGIVERFLTFATPAAPEFALADLGEVLHEVVPLIEQDHRAADVQLLVHVDPSTTPLTFDADQVKQVVWNLVSNALDAGVTTVALRVRPSPHGVEVRVADDGPGMPPEVLTRAGEPFHTTKAQGTGLGLAISKRIVEAHGGSLRLESAVGRGTTVSFTLPRTSPSHSDREAG